MDNVPSDAVFDAVQDLFAAYRSVAFKFMVLFGILFGWALSSKETQQLLGCKPILATAMVSTLLLSVVITVILTSYKNRLNMVFDDLERLVPSVDSDEGVYACYRITPRQHRVNGAAFYTFAFVLCTYLFIIHRYA